MKTDEHLMLETTRGAKVKSFVLIYLGSVIIFGIVTEILRLLLRYL